MQPQSFHISGTVSETENYIKVQGNDSVHLFSKTWYKTDKDGMISQKDSKPHLYALGSKNI